MNLGMKLFVGAHVFIYQASGGRVATTMGGRKLVLITTTGRKTGQARTVPAVPFLDGERVFVMASMAGAPEHPAWFRNLEANPAVTVQLGRDRWPARARILEGEERTALWERICADMPNFAAYQNKTSRVIPVVELVRQRS